MSEYQIDLALKALSAFSLVLSCFSVYVSFFAGVGRNEK